MKSDGALQILLFYPVEIRKGLMDTLCQSDPFDIYMTQGFLYLTEIEYVNKDGEHHGVHPDQDLLKLVNIYNFMGRQDDGKDILELGLSVGSNKNGHVDHIDDPSQNNLER